MWPDNETSRDFLNFRGVADTVAEIVVQANGRPISIGVSGAWGSGKSSMIRLVHESLVGRPVVKGQRPFVFVEFNAWLYQGYDDARAALTEVIANRLMEEAEKRKSGTDKALDLLGRVNWLRIAKLTAGSALAIGLGLPPTGLIGDTVRIGKKVIAGETDADTIKDAEATAASAWEESKGLLLPKTISTPPQAIHALRQSLEDTLEAIGVTLVVLIDDLDRCLPETTISTLEAIRLFLFLKNTAFVVAADTEMIKHAVRKHFDGVDDQMVTSYFDKLIQVPIRVPPLGTQEVRAYMMMLFIDNSDLPDTDKDRIRAEVCKQLGQSWQGKRVDRAFLETLHASYPPSLLGQLDTAERLAPIMTGASGIVGNPRLVKRFLNAVSIRLAIARAQGIDIDQAALAKMLLFERYGSGQAYGELIASVSASAEGKPSIISEWEETVAKSAEPALSGVWDTAFVKEWLSLPPRLGDMDLRGILYVSREHAPLITPEDRLSSVAVDLLTALLTHPETASIHSEALGRLSRPETTVIMDRLLDRARREQEWGAPPILDACLALAQGDANLGQRLAAFLRDRPVAQLAPSIVPKIGDQPWAKSVFDKWEGEAAKPLKNAIKSWRADGDVAI